MSEDEQRLTTQGHSTLPNVSSIDSLTNIISVAASGNIGTYVPCQPFTYVVAAGVTAAVAMSCILISRSFKWYHAREPLFVVTVFDLSRVILCTLPTQDCLCQSEFSLRSHQWYFMFLNAHAWDCLGWSTLYTLFWILMFHKQLYGVTVVRTMPVPQLLFMFVSMKINSPISLAHVQSYTFQVSSYVADDWNWQVDFKSASSSGAWFWYMQPSTAMLLTFIPLKVTCRHKQASME